jgi:MYXO-CTERM domain-containing protein
MGSPVPRRFPRASAVLGPALVCLLAQSLSPGRADAYALAGEGEIVRVDVVLAWDGERQVLALLPDVSAVGEGAFFVVPVPAGTEEVVPPDVDAFRRPQRDPDPSDEAAAEAGDGGASEAQAQPDALPAVPGRPMATRRPNIAASRDRILHDLRTRDATHRRPEGEVILVAGTGADAVRALSAHVGEAAFGRLPQAALTAYAEAGWTFAVLAMPAHEGRMRFGPLALSMPSGRPTIPIRLAAGGSSHPLGMHLISKEAPADLGTMAFAFGLRHVSRPVRLPRGLEAWMQATGFAPDGDWRMQGLSAGPFESERHPLAGVQWDLIVPRPQGDDVAKVVAAGEAAPKTGAADAELPRGRGCGCSAVSGTGAGGASMVGLLLFALVWSRRRRAGARAAGSVRATGAGLVLLSVVLGVPLRADTPAAFAEEGTVATGPSETGRHARRALRYPEATEAEAEPPILRLAAGGAPLALYLSDASLDPRGEVHFVTIPDRLGLRIAERTAYVHTTPSAVAGDTGLLTVTLDSGRPLSFEVQVVASGARSDATVEVVTRPEAAPVACVSALAHARDELAECRESSGERAVALIAGLLVEAPTGERAVEHRGVRWRDKQNRMFVEIVDAVRLYEHTYLRLRIENRDGSRKTWVAGEPTLTVVGPGPRRRPLALVSIFEQTAVETGEAALVVLGVQTPQVPTGASLRLALHEADGQRHVVIDDLRL